MGIKSHWSMSKLLFKLAGEFERKYQRVDIDPDRLNPDDPSVDPEQHILSPYEEEEIGEGNPNVSGNMAEYLFKQIWPHFIRMSPEEQRKFLSSLSGTMKKL